MRNRIQQAMFVTAAFAVIVSAPGGATAAAGQARTPDGKPDFSGIWQADTTANWDLPNHGPPPMVPQAGVYPHVPGPGAPGVALGNVGWVPPGLGGVRRDVVPYQ